jgi:adenine-specific DNA-methyltransferase
MPILQWLDREKTIKKANQSPYRLLESDHNLSYGDQNSQNMMIQGDNLEALKALLPYYANRVKCIYIDPPYNTGSAFEHYDDNLEHSTWLNMMYPRLELLRELLAEDGSVWISIDADESHYLKVIMDEIFERKNFIDEIVWQRSYAPINLKKTLSRNHDTILVYAKNIFLLDFKKLSRTNESDNRFSNPDNDPRGSWASGPIQVGPRVESRVYEIITPSGRKILPPAEFCWRISKEKYEEMVSDNRIYFGIKGDNVPRIKRFLSEVKNGIVPMTLWLRNETGDNQEGKKEIKFLFDQEVFSTPKPERLIHRILTLATNEGDLVLDSFLGSGTTAAVAHKMNRRWIGIEIGEHAKTHCAVRLQKVIDGEQGGISKAVDWQGGGGFRFYHLGETIFDKDGCINKNIKFEHLAAHIWFSETKTPITDKDKSPLIGVYNKTAYYLLYNGILGDKSVSGGNVLTTKTLDALPKYNGKKVIYGETTRLSSLRLEENKITFKQTPYDIKAR